MPGTHFFSYGAINGGAVPTPFPAEANLVMQWRTEDIAPQADNTTLATWTDRISGANITQATDVNRPKYRTNRVNGYPALEFLANQWFEVGRPTPLINALNQNRSAVGATLYFVLRNIGSTGPFRGLWSAGNINDGDRTVVVSQDYIGNRGAPRIYPLAERPEKSAGFQVIAIRSSSVVGGFFHQNTNAYSVGNAGLPLAEPTNGYTLGASQGNSAWAYTGDILEVGVFNKDLSFAEVIKLQKHLCDKYAQAYPWASASRYVIFDGDSQTSTVFGTPLAGKDGPSSAWGPQMMATKGQPFFGFTNMSHSGRLMTEMTAAVDKNFTGVGAELGIPVYLNAFEFYNQQSSNLTLRQPYWDAVKAASPGIKIAWGTSIDSANYNAGQDTARAAYNAAHSPTPTNVDVVVPLHTNVNWGVQDSWSATYMQDNIHMNVTGTTDMAAFWGPYFDTLIAL